MAHDQLPREVDTFYNSLLIAKTASGTEMRFTLVIVLIRTVE